MGRTSGLPSESDLEPELTTAELLEVGRRRLKARLNSLDGVALVRAVGMLEALVKNETHQAGPGAAEADILDVVANIDLPVDRKVALLDAEWQRLMDRAADIARYSEELTGTQKEIDEQLADNRRTARSL